MSDLLVWNWDKCIFEKLQKWHRYSSSHNTIPYKHFTNEDWNNV